MTTARPALDPELQGLLSSMPKAPPPKSCFLEANSLLVLNRAHLGHGAELLVERRDTHAAQLRQFLKGRAL
jgi:hypothetical protein